MNDSTREILARNLHGADKPEQRIVKRFSLMNILVAVLLVLNASSALPQGTEGGGEKQESPEPPGGNRVLGVLPNYRTVDEADVRGPLSAREKLTIARKDSTDYSVILLGGGLAGLGQLTNQNPQFGQGAVGFGKRFVTAFADESIGNLMSEGVFPAILHEDPRYYRRGSGSTGSRITYALSRVIVTHNDSGRLQFNYSEWLGNAVGVGISNSYYSNGRTAESNAVKLMEQVGIDGLSQILKEVWPDLKRKLFERSPDRKVH